MAACYQETPQSVSSRQREEQPAPACRVLVSAIAFVYVIRQISAVLFQSVGQANSQFDQADLERRAGQSQLEYVLRDQSSSRLAWFRDRKNHLKVAID